MYMYVYIYILTMIIDIIMLGAFTYLKQKISSSI